MTNSMSDDDAEDDVGECVDIPKSYELGMTSRKKTVVLLDFLQIASPLRQFGQLVLFILNAKNVDLSDIQNDSLSKILLK